jgi:hypothetical protein
VFMARKTHPFTPVLIPGAIDPTSRGLTGHRPDGVKPGRLALEHLPGAAASLRVCWCGRGVADPLARLPLVAGPEDRWPVVEDFRGAGRSSPA